jgi:hypothetical protein
MHGSLALWPALLAWAQISWYLKQIRKDRAVPVVNPTGWSIMRGRHVARPTRTLLRAAQGQQQVGG